MTLVQLLESIDIKKVANGKIKFGVLPFMDGPSFMAHMLQLPEVQKFSNLVLEISKLGPAVLLTEAEKVYLRIQEEIQNQKQQVKADKLAKKIVGQGFPEYTQAIVGVMEECIPFCDIKTGKIRFFHEPSSSPMQFHESVYTAVKGLTAAQLRAQATLGYIEFDPMSLEPLERRALNGVPTIVMNSHIPPNWRRATPSNLAECPSPIMRLLVNVFPDDKSLQYVLGWIRQSVVGKNETILCLVGPRGVGKTTVTGLISCGVGKHYTSQADGAFLDEKFTSSELEEKRLTILEEVTLDSRKRIDKLKRVTNLEVKIEAKGEDAKTAKSYTSFIVVNNHLNQMPISSEERRFSIVEIGTKNLTSVMASEEIEELVEAFNRNQEDEPHQMVVDFYHWILANEFEFNNVVPFKGRYYQEVVFESLPLIEREVIELILEKPNQEFTLKDFKKHLKNKHGSDKIHINVDMLRKFLDNYSFKGMFKVGKLEAKWDSSRNKQYTIVPSEEMNQYALSQIPDEDKPGKPGGLLNKARTLSKAQESEDEDEEDFSNITVTDSQDDEMIEDGENYL